MINEYSLLWRRLVTLAASCWGRWSGPHSPHCSGVKPIGCVHKFHHIAEQNVIGSARILCLCFHNLIQAILNACWPTSVVLRSSSFQSSEHEKPEMLVFITLNWPSILWCILTVTTDWEAIYHTFKILYKTQAQVYMFTPLSCFNSVCIWCIACSAKKYTSNMRKRNLCKTDA